MQISEHFSIDDLAITTEKAYIEQNKKEAEKYKGKLTTLAVTLLEPIYVKYNGILVTSCFRCPSLNKAIGGTTSSQHILGQAADFVMKDKATKLIDVFNWIKDKSGLRYRQLILEKNQWIHIAITNNDGKLNENLIYDGKTYKRV